MSRIKADIQANASLLVVCSIIDVIVKCLERTGKCPFQSIQAFGNITQNYRTKYLIDLCLSTDTIYNISTLLGQVVTLLYFYNMLELKWLKLSPILWECAYGKFRLRKKIIRGTEMYEIWEGEELLENALTYFGFLKEISSPHYKDRH